MKQEHSKAKPKALCHSFLLWSLYTLARLNPPVYGHALFEKKCLAAFGRFLGQPLLGRPKPVWDLLQKRVISPAKTMFIPYYLAISLESFPRWSFVSFLLERPLKEFEFEVEIMTRSGIISVKMILFCWKELNC